VSDFVTDSILAAIELPALAENTASRLRKVNSLINQADIHLGKIAGGPGKDPDFDHHRKEIKVFLENAAKKAKRLPTKLREATLRRILDIAEQAGIEVSI